MGSLMTRLVYQLHLMNIFNKCLFQIETEENTEKYNCYLLQLWVLCSSLEVAPKLKYYWNWHAKLNFKFMLPTLTGTLQDIYY